VSEFNPKLCNIREVRESDDSTPASEPETQTETTEGEL
jgi:hypothetical protein